MKIEKNPLIEYLKKIPLPVNAQVELLVWGLKSENGPAIIRQALVNRLGYEAGEREMNKILAFTNEELRAYATELFTPALPSDNTEEKHIKVSHED